MPDKNELWEFCTAIYNDRRQELLEELEALDFWYGELNVLLAEDEADD